jgi:hypothetical protein
MPRPLDTATLDNMARWMASQWLRPDSVKSPSGNWIFGPEWVLQELYKYDYTDEHEHLIAALRKQLMSDRLKDFDDAAKQRFSPRDPKEHAEILAEKLAIDPNGKHIDGKVGRVIVGSRFIRLQNIEIEHPGSRVMRRMAGLGKEHRQTYQRLQPYYWPIYAGEEEERKRGSDQVDPLPPDAGFPAVVAATDFTISNEAAIAGLDAICARLDEGSSTPIISGRTSTKPASVDDATTGTQLFLCTMNGTAAFGAAADATDKARATAAAIADDTSADATNTLGYCRCSASNDGSTALDDHMDLNAGTSAADIIFNTLSIVSGGTVSITSFTVDLPEQA